MDLLNHTGLSKNVKKELLDELSVDGEKTLRLNVSPNMMRPWYQKKPTADDMAKEVIAASKDWRENPGRVVDSIDGDMKTYTVEEWMARIPKRNWIQRKINQIKSKWNRFFTWLWYPEMRKMNNAMKQLTKMMKEQNGI